MMRATKTLDRMRIAFWKRPRTLQNREPLIASMAFTKSPPV